MPRAPELSDAARSSVARQIGERLPAAPGTALQKQRFLVESFPIFVLPADRISEPGDSLDDRLQDTGRWHHQILEGAQVKMFARSRPGEGPDVLEVEEVVEGPSAPAIRQAAAFIDDTSAMHAGADAEAALIIAPAFYLTAFWLRDGPNRQWIVVADRPSGLQTLSPRTWYSVREFLQRLAERPAPFGMPTDVPNLA